MFERRPWGTFTVLDDGDDCKVKRLTVDAGERLSYQSHARRAEHWVVVSGSARVTVDGEDRDLGPGEAIDIPLGAAHRVSTQGSCSSLQNSDETSCPVRDRNTRCRTRGRYQS